MEASFDDEVAFGFRFNQEPSRPFCKGVTIKLNRAQAHKPSEA